MVAVKRVKGICRAPGCNALVQASEKGYCSRHKRPDYKITMLKNKAPGSAKFYSAAAWQKTRNAFITLHPCCTRCKIEKGITVKGDVVHHTTERVDLIAAGKNPYAFKYLETICFSCHRKELQLRRKDKNQRKKFYWE